MTKKPVSLTYFSSEELMAAAGQFDTLYDESIESPSDYMQRKRERDMRKVIGFVVENELDETKRRIFTKVFFDGEKISDVAEKLNMTSSGVYKHYEKSLKIIGDSLRYVDFYQNVSREDRMKTLESMKKSSLSALKNMSYPAVSMRLIRLMEKENIQSEMLCTLLGFDKKRLDEIFYGKIHPFADEVVSLAGFFGVSTDYILKGDLS